MKKNGSRKITGLSSEETSAQRRGEVQRDLKSLLQVIEAAPDAYLILSPDLEIQLVTDAYLAAMQVKREDVAGKHILDAYLDSSVIPEQNAAASMYESLNRVLETGKPHQVAIQQQDVPLLAQQGGGSKNKYWNTLNTPVLNDAGEVIYIIHQVSDVTEFSNSQNNTTYSSDEQHLLQAALDQLQLTQQMLEVEHRRHANAGAHRKL